MTGPASAHLHISVVRPVPALWHGPCDIATWLFDVAGFAMHTVLEIHNELRRLTFFPDEFVNPRGAVAL